MMTPIRRLEGITYWVIDDPDGIYDFVNREIRKEWEADARFEGRDPEQDLWLRALPKRRWRLEITELACIRLNPVLMNYVDEKRRYNFQESLDIRSRELRESIEKYSVVIWPVIVRMEDFMLIDGYCRYSVMKAMKIHRIYIYLGTL